MRNVITSINLPLMKFTKKIILETLFQRTLRGLRFAPLRSKTLRSDSAR